MDKAVQKCPMCGKLIRKRNKKYCCATCGVQYRKLKKEKKDGK